MIGALALLSYAVFLVAFARAAWWLMRLLERRAIRRLARRLLTEDEQLWIKEMERKR